MGFRVVAPAPSVWYVDADNTSGTENGLSWATAFRSIQAAVDAASAGESVWVAEGRYAATSDSVVTMKEGVNLYGSFVGNEALAGFDLGTRDFHAHQTVVDGENTRRCVRAASAKLDGFTIINGRSYGAVTCETEPLCHVEGCGAAVLALSVAPEIRNCVFADNQTDSGAAVQIVMNPSAVTIADCRFLDNAGSILAGEIHAGGALALASELGFGATLERCVFYGNHSRTDGAAFYAGLYPGTLTVTDCTFKNNESDDLVGDGGAVQVQATTALFDRCTFSHNQASSDGGAIHVRYSHATLQNCLFDHNSAVDGGAIFIRNNPGDTCSIVNCTIADNVATGNGSAIISEDDTVATLANCIVWGNSGNGVFATEEIATHQVDYSCVQGGFAGTGNIDADPLFHAPTAGNYFLKTGSPCIDVADDATAPTDDLMKRARPMGSHADMGALEHDPSGKVFFPDANLEGAIRKAINKLTGDILPADLEALTEFSAEGLGIIDLAGLEYCTNLTNLELRSNAIFDISPLATLHELRELNLGDNCYEPKNGNEISDLSPLASLTQLKLLCVSDNPLSDASSIGLLTNLEHLTLDGCGISDIAYLSTCGSLRLLGISENPICDISALSALENLTVLSVQGDNIEDLSPIYEMTQLEALFIGRNPLEPSDVQFLANMTNLTSLGVQMVLPSISLISGLTRLEWLWMYSNPVSDLDLLASFTNLQFIELVGCEITDLSFLQNLPNLDGLTLGNNPISDLSPLVANPALRLGDTVELQGCPNLSDTALCEQIPALRMRGVHVTVSTECPEPMDYAYYHALFTNMWFALFEVGGLSLLDPQTADLNNDGVPDLWMLELMAWALGNPNSLWHQAAMDCYQHNLAVLRSTSPSENVASIIELFAAILATSESMHTFAAAVSEFPDGFDPLTAFCAVTAGKSPNEPFAGDGDYDGDGATNIEEYMNVRDQGFGISTFIYLVTNPALDGSEPLPVSGATGLAILILSLGRFASAQLKRRR